MTMVNDCAGPFLGKMILITTDAYSKWIDAQIVNTVTASVTIEQKSIYRYVYIYVCIWSNKSRTHTKIYRRKVKNIAQLFYLWSANLSLLWPQNEMLGIHCIPYIYECRLNYWFVAQIQSLKYTRIWFNRW